VEEVAPQIGRNRCVTAKSRLWHVFKL
jgi:hypothetical protein